MENAWDEQINLSSADSDYRHDNSDVVISRCHPYPEGASWDDVKINYCPFCGKPINVEII